MPALSVIGVALDVVCRVPAALATKHSGVGRRWRRCARRGSSSVGCGSPLSTCGFAASNSVGMPSIPTLSRSDSVVRNY